MHPLALCDKLWKASSIKILHDGLWEVGFFGVLCIVFWNSTSIIILHIDVRFQNATSPFPLIPHLEHLKPCMANFEWIGWWSGYVVRSIHNTLISYVRFHHNYKWVLHFHHQMQNNMALWEGRLKYENNLELAWDLALMKCLTWALMVIGWSHSQEE